MTMTPAPQRRCRYCDREGCEDHCVWCGATVEESTCPRPVPRHATSCPTQTGVYPLEPGFESLACMKCGDPIGTHYMLMQSGDEPDVSETVCLPCGIIGEVTDG
jgi:hypothetical protein